MVNEFIGENNNDATESDIKDFRWFDKTRNILYYILGLLEVLLLFRLVFKGFSANPNNSFVAMIYSITNVLIAPFKGIFNIITGSNAITYVLEPSSIIAMVVYAIIFYGIIKLIRVTVIET